MNATLKPITVRLPEDDLERAREEAEALGVGVGVYLRMLFRQGLHSAPAASAVRQRRAEALRRFGKAMAAEMQGMTEGDQRTTGILPQGFPAVTYGQKSLRENPRGMTEEDAVRLAKGARKRLAESHTKV